MDIQDESTLEVEPLRCIVYLYLSLRPLDVNYFFATEPPPLLTQLASEHYFVHNINCLRIGNYLAYVMFGYSCKPYLQLLGKDFY